MCWRPDFYGGRIREHHEVQYELLRRLFMTEEAHGDIQWRAIESSNMNDEWKRWEGRTVDGIFVLQRFLGGSDHSAVFLTDRQNGGGERESAAIKVIAAEADAEKQLARWRAAQELDDPNLIRIFASGRAELDGMGLLYVVEEYAEENLAQILPERALTAEEVGMMLPPVLKALQYVHARGLVHGRIRPSNILAIGDRVKLSSDSVGAPGEIKRPPEVYDPPEAATGADSGAGDVWRLGTTLVEVLTQRIPAWDRSGAGAPEIPRDIPEPFREIAGRCLQLGAGERWTIVEIRDRLGTEPTSRVAKAAARAAVPERENLEDEYRPQPSKSAMWPYVLLLAVVVVAILFLMTRAKTPGTAGRTPVESAPAAAPQAEPSAAQPESQGGRAVADSNDTGVVRRVMPEVSPSARRTIRGTIKIRMRVEVDAAGNVTSAKIESGGTSRYFSRLAIEAARQWKFSPASGGAGAREWKLQFAFSRSRTETSAARVKG
ncbi:MAG TPA: TonB family protein [Terriglobales bacterium]|jgi:TonB family protein|nr:TonB family protein [Terriglobales bacterium]